MSIQSIKSYPQNENHVITQDVKPWKKICKLVWNIFWASMALISTMFLVSNPSIVLTFENTMLYLPELFFLTTYIYFSYSFFIDNLYEAEKNLCSFWKGHEVEKA
ncbi:MAG: hypothetical protein WCT85_02030 [Parachlamydiales bacterium]|jgi:hypothetical protein